MATERFHQVGLLVPGAAHNATIRAITEMTVLAMDQATFEHLMMVSQVTHDRLLAVAQERTAHLPASEVTQAVATHNGGN